MKKINIFYPLLSFLFLISCNVSVNKSIEIRDGEKVSRSLNTVNGNIRIGSSCEVLGDCRTVNGMITVGKNSRVTDLKTVNGSIDIDENVQVEGSLESVNGDIDCQNSVIINQGIGTVNGNVDLRRTTVQRDISTYNGNITLADHSIVERDVTIKKPSGTSDRKRQLEIRISGESVVNGDIRVEEDDLDVTVYLESGGKVNGRIQNAEIIDSI